VRQWLPKCTHYSWTRSPSVTYGSSLFIYIMCIEEGRFSWFHTFAVFCMLYAFFWVINRLLNFICRRFGTFCLFPPLHALYSDPSLPCHPPSYWLRLFSSQTFSRMNTTTFFFQTLSFYTYLPIKMEQSVSKRRHIKFRRRGNYPEVNILHRVGLCEMSSLTKSD